MMGRGVAWECGLGLGLGIVIGWLGYRRGLLSLSGIVGLAFTSLLGFSAGGWVWGSLFWVVFVSSGLWLRFRRSHKDALLDGTSETVARDWLRIVAGTGWASALALLHLLAPGVAGVFAAFLGALATTNADIWATELGMLSPRAPRLVITRRRVAAGTPGAISTLGTVASLAGAWLVGFMALLLVMIQAQSRDMVWDRALVWLPVAATAGGMAGSLVDSFLGATAQGIYYCEGCKTETDQRVHSCGEVARQVRGWAWLTNDGIDLVSSIVGAAVAAGSLSWLAETRMWW